MKYKMSLDVKRGYVLRNLETGEVEHVGHNKENAIAYAFGTKGATEIDCDGERISKA